MNVLSSSSAVISLFSRREKAQNTKVIGTRKLPSSTSVGTRLGFPVMNVTTTVSSHRTSPDRNIRSQSRRGRPALKVAIQSLWSVTRPPASPSSLRRQRSDHPGRRADREADADHDDQSGGERRGGRRDPGRERGEPLGQPLPALGG